MKYLRKGYGIYRENLLNTFRTNFIKDYFGIAISLFSHNKLFKSVTTKEEKSGTRNPNFESERSEKYFSYYASYLQRRTESIDPQYYDLSHHQSVHK